MRAELFNEGGRTDMTKPRVTFLDFVNPPTRVMSVYDLKAYTEKGVAAPLIFNLGAIWRYLYLFFRRVRKIAKIDY